MYHLLIRKGLLNMKTVLIVGAMVEYLSKRQKFS